MATAKNRPSKPCKFKSGEGMSKKNTTEKQRADFLHKIQDEVSEDCVKYGFSIGYYFQEPIADYFGNAVEKELKP